MAFVLLPAAGAAIGYGLGVLGGVAAASLFSYASYGWLAGDCVGKPSSIDRLPIATRSTP